MRNCFNCMHKKVDLWNFDYSDDNAHSCQLGFTDRMLNLRNQMKGVKEETDEFNLDCHEFSEQQKKLDSFLTTSHKILDELIKITDEK